MNRQTASLRGDSSQKAQSAGSANPNIAKRDGPAVLTEISSADDWEKLCGDTFKGICAIGFMGAPKGVDPEDANNLALFQTAIDSMDLNAAYNFVWVDASCQTALAEVFEVSGGATPALAVYSPLKGRYAKYVGSFDKVQKCFLSCSHF